MHPRPVRAGDARGIKNFEGLGLQPRFPPPLTALARELGVPSNPITAILAGDRSITAETAILLGERFAMSAEFWLNLQMMHELEQAWQHMRRAP
jgi:addiction module HigA family antidote